MSPSRAPPAARTDSICRLCPLPDDVVEVHLGDLDWIVHGQLLVDRAMLLGTWKQVGEFSLLVGVSGTGAGRRLGSTGRGVVTGDQTYWS